MGTYRHGCLLGTLNSTASQEFFTFFSHNVSSFGCYNVHITAITMVKLDCHVTYKPHPPHPAISTSYLWLPDLALHTDWKFSFQFDKPKLLTCVGVSQCPPSWSQEWGESWEGEGGREGGRDINDTSENCLKLWENLRECVYSLQALEPVVYHIIVTIVHVERRSQASQTWDSGPLRVNVLTLQQQAWGRGCSITRNGWKCKTLSFIRYSEAKIALLALYMSVMKSPKLLNWTLECFVWNYWADWPTDRQTHWLTEQSLNPAVRMRTRGNNCQ